MKLTLSYNKSVHENAAHYYELAKESREKIAGVERAIIQTEKELEKATTIQKAGPRVKRDRDWYEKFHFMKTSSNRLVIGGRNSQQNDLVVARHMEDNDLFFHADIQGATVVVLKDGLAATDQELQEAAQFAACFSNAWKNGNAAVDVYAVSKVQLTKHVQGGFIPTGAFGITGERRWFKNTRLALRIGIDDLGGVLLVPEVSSVQLKKNLVLVPSLAGKDKGALAKSLAKRFDVHPDDLLELLPNGKSKTIEG